MDITQDTTDAKFIITGYEHDCVMINHEPHYQSVLISPETLLSPWEVTSTNDLNEISLSEILDQQPEIVIIGTGENLILPDPKIIALFAQRGVGLETMNTSAACRTYGILASESRKAMAGIIFPRR